MNPVTEAVYDDEVVEVEVKPLVTVVVVDVVPVILVLFTKKSRWP
jgi:hypothetical protein